MRSYILREFIEDFVLPAGLACGAIMLGLLVILFPLFYLDGQAKSAWLKESRGIDLPWWKAAPLVIEINDTDATLDLE